MAAKEFTKSGTFVIVVLLLVVLLVPFALEQIGDTTGLFRFQATKWVKDLFRSKTAAVVRNPAKVDWDRQLQDLKEFSNWADGMADAKITIVRPEEFQVERADENPITSSHCTWRLVLISGSLEMDANQIRGKLRVFREPDGGVTGEIASVTPLKDGKKGFLVKAENVGGAGKIGLSYDDGPPVYYDVKLRHIWLVPIAGCRSATGTSEAAVFFPGLEASLGEGDEISPGKDKCGYRILSISDRCVWFEAFYGDKPPEDTLPRSIWPDFSRIDTRPPVPPPGRLVFGRNRYFWRQDAIKLPNSGWYLMVDDFLDGRAVVFRMLDSNLRPIRGGDSEIVCVIVREK